MCTTAIDITDTGDNIWDRNTVYSSNVCGGIYIWQSSKKYM